MLVGVLVVLSGTTGRPLAADQPNPPRVDVRVAGGRLSVHARAAPLQSILEQLRRVSGIQIVLEEPFASRGEGALVTIDFDRLTLDEGLRRLLKDENLVLVYSETRLVEARVYGATPSASRPRTADAPGAPAFMAPPPASSAVAVDSARDLVRLAALNEATETQEVERIARLRRDALGLRDPRQRVHALEALAMSSDPQTTVDTLLAVFERESDSTVLRHALEIARGAALPLEPLSKLAVNGRDPTVRITALKRLGERGSEDLRVRDVLRDIAARDRAGSVRDAAKKLLEELY